LKIIVKKNAKFRFSVGDPENRRSHIWSVAARRSDVYVSSGGPSPTKFSFHKSGICRDAFTSEHGAPEGMQDRVVKRWRRAETPPPNTGGASAVLDIIIPTDFLSDGLIVPEKEIFWIAAAPIAQSTCVRMFYSADEPMVAQPLIWQAQLTPIAGILLENGEWFYLAGQETQFSGQEIRIPAAGNRAEDLLIKRNGFQATRWGRIILFNYPQDGERQIAWEYGAFKCSPQTIVPVDGAFSSPQVFHSSGWNS
jgi:hypothetical protein